MAVMPSKFFPHQSWNSKFCPPSFKPSCLSLFSPEADCEIRILRPAVYLVSGPRKTKGGMGITDSHHWEDSLCGQLRLKCAAELRETVEDTYRKFISLRGRELGYWYSSQSWAHRCWGWKWDRDQEGEQNRLLQPRDKPSGKKLLGLKFGSQEMAKLMGTWGWKLWQQGCSASKLRNGFSSWAKPILILLKEAWYKF